MSTDAQKQSADYNLADVKPVFENIQGNNTLLDSLPIWLSAQTAKSAGRGRSADNTHQYGVQKLRELILELAVRGKLVEQDPNDEPASILLEKIAVEKARLVKEGKIKQQKDLSPLTEEEKSFSLQQGWCWTKLGCISAFTNGYAFKSSDFGDQGVGIVKIGDIQNGEISQNSMSRVSANVVADLDDNLQVKPGEMLIAMSGATTGKLGFNSTAEIFYINQRVGKIAPYILPNEFLYHPLTTKIQENLSKSAGSAIPNLSTSQIKDIVIALPPLAEQHRIVKKVNELMTLCDKLEQQQANAVQAHDTLVKVLLDTLTQSDNADDFQQNWHRIAEHFDTLFTTKSSIDQLKQTLLQLAVMGKLVPQDANDEPASVLLEKIAAAKAKLVKQGKIKKQKPLPEISNDETPFPTPKGWAWVKFGILGEFINGDRGKNYPNKDEYVDKGVPWINTGHIEPDGTLTKTGMNFITKEKFESLRSGKIEEDDLVYCLRGATFGKTAHVYPYSQGAIASSLMIVRPIFPDLKYFIFRYLISPLGRSQIFRFDNGSAQPNLSANSVGLYAFPLPPLAEQHRIVKKVDELMALCDQLKYRLNQAQTLQQQLADAVVEQSLA